MIVPSKVCVVIIMVTSLLGCSSQPEPVLSSGKWNLASGISLTSVPFHAQQERDDCGPAALAMMFGWAGISTDPATLAPAVYTPGRRGTLQSDIIQATRRAGRLAISIQSFEDLLAELNDGRPVLVLQNLGLDLWPVWHYAVAIGYDLDRQTLFLHSGREQRLATSFTDFKKTWRSAHQWALTITRPRDLPLTANEPESLKAANGLELTGRSHAAATAYGAVLERWPNSFPALMGFGNARYAEGNLSAASTAFRHAVTLHPTSAEAWNNLAVSLSDQNRKEEALNAARRAVKLGGPHQAVARKTLADLERPPS